MAAKLGSVWTDAIHSVEDNNLSSSALSLSIDRASKADRPPAPPPGEDDASHPGRADASIDTSAVVAILADEPEAAAFLACIEATDRYEAGPHVRLEATNNLARIHGRPI